MIQRHALRIVNNHPIVARIGHVAFFTVTIEKDSQRLRKRCPDARAVAVICRLEAFSGETRKRHQNRHN
jgi:hypothetical protein